MTTRILITGSREWTDRKAIQMALSVYGYDVDLCHGGARGADSIAGEIAAGWGIPVSIFQADWQKHGKRAGPIRNQQMLDEFKPDVVLAFPVPSSRGTFDMIERARKAGVRFEVYFPGDARLRSIAEVMSENTA